MGVSNYSYHKYNIKYNINTLIWSGGCCYCYNCFTFFANADDQYDEPEGIFPDGVYTLTECDHHDPQGTRNIDLYKLKLDGTGEDYTRLTFFNEVEGFRASNPVVRDDGLMIVFQASLSGSEAGAGCGLYLLHF